MLNPRAFANSLPDGFGVLEIVGEPLLPQYEGAPVARLFVPLRRSELHGEIAGPVAALRLTQTFLFTRRQCRSVVEATYRFPLPGDAAVTGVRVRFGEVEINATLAERAAAEQTYRQARDEGRQAALLTRESPDVFTLHVVGIEPDQPVVVETAYVQLARAAGAGWSLRVPLTTAPRYVRADEAGSRSAHGQPLALLRDPGHRFAINLTLTAAASASSSTHALHTARDGGRLTVTLRDGETVPDRDFVLAWQPPGEAERPALLVLLHEDETANVAHFLALVVPPTVVDAQTAPSREVLLLVDHSGSMEGPKWEAADWAVKAFLAGLSPRDTFNLGLFHDTTHWLSTAPLGADPSALARAAEFLTAHRDSGGTELGVALEQALRQERLPGDRSRHVLIVTDAQVSDLGRMLHLVEQEAGRPDRRRVSVLCIDAAPNAYLVRSLAECGGGSATFLTSSPSEGDVTTALGEVLAHWSAPVLTDLRLDVNRDAVQAAGRAVLTLPDAGHRSIDLGDISSGASTWVLGRTTRGGAAPLELALTDAHGSTLASTAAEHGGWPALATLFGARRVADLEAVRNAGDAVEEGLRRLGYAAAISAADASTSPMQAQPIYPENRVGRYDDLARSLLVREALQAGIACSETAFVATRSVAGRPVGVSVAVANALPHGWTGQFTTPLSATPSFHTGGVAPMMGAPGDPSPSAYEPCFRLADRPSSPLDRVRDLVRRFRPAHPARQRPDDDTAPGRSALTTLFDGVPRFAAGSAVLYDSDRDGERLPWSGTLRRLVVRLAGGSPANATPDGLALLLFVEDPTVPRVRVRLADLLRAGGERPLNVEHRRGRLLRVVLTDADGAWAGTLPRLVVSVG